MIENSKTRKTIFRNFEPATSKTTPMSCQETGAGYANNGVIAAHLSPPGGGSWDTLLADQKNFGPHYNIFPLVSKGVKKDQRIGDTIKMTFYNNRHDLDIYWPEYNPMSRTDQQNPNGKRDFASVSSELQELNNTRVYIYECMARLKSEGQITQDFPNVVYKSDNQLQMMQYMLARFQNYIAAVPQDLTQIQTPVNTGTQAFINSVTVSNMWGTKQNKSEVPASVLDEREKYFSTGFKVLRVHKIKPPRRRMYTLQDNPTPQVPDVKGENQYGWKDVTQRRKCGLATKMNTRVHFRSDTVDTDLKPRNGFCYFQIIYITNPNEASVLHLPSIRMRNGTLRVSWHD